MDEEGKKALMKEFKDSDGSKRLDLWDYAIGQQVIWENIIAGIQKISKEQKVEKELEKMMDKALKEAEK